MSKSKSPPAIETINVKELHVQEGYNVRSEKEVKANAAEIAAAWKAQGGQDATEPMQYIERGGKKYTRSHARLQAAKELGYKTVFAVKAERDWLSDQVHLVTGNEGHPLNQIQQGAVYVRLRDGVNTGEVGSEVIAPMNAKSIAALVGKSPVHVGNCIAIVESPKPIAELIVAGKVSANAVILAGKGSTEAQSIKVVLAAVDEAEKEGKGIATEKHVKAVKPAIVAPKPPKLKAAAPQAPADQTGDEESLLPKKNKAAPEPASGIEAIQGDDKKQEAHEEPELIPASKTASKKTLKAELVTILDVWSTKFDVPLEDEAIDGLIDAIIAANFPF